MDLIMMQNSLKRLTARRKTSAPPTGGVQAAGGIAAAGGTASIAGTEAYDHCDEFIRRCKSVIRAKDVRAARQIRHDATAIFGSVIPGWNGALMGQFTGFYLDDAEMILAKLAIFRANRDRQNPCDYVNLSRVAIRIMAMEESFDQALSQIRDDPLALTADLLHIHGMLRRYQTIAEGPLEPGERWEKARPFVLWATTLDAALARHIVPLLVHSVR